MRFAESFEVQGVHGADAQFRPENLGDLGAHVDLPGASCIRDPCGPMNATAADSDSNDTAATVNLTRAGPS